MNMNKNKIRFISLSLVSSMFLSGCEMKLEGIFYKGDFDSFKSSTTSTTIEDEPEIKEEIEIIPTEGPTEESTEVTTQPTFPSPVEEETTPEETEQPVEETTVPPTTIPENDEDVVVTVIDDVNMRSSNTTASLKIGSLKLGDTALRIFSCDNNWDLVQHDGQIAYVSRDYLKYSDTYEDGYEYEIKNDIVLTTTDLNLRPTPSTDKARIDYLPTNTELQVLAEVDNGWLLVKHNGIIGYVNGDYTESLLEKAKRQYPNLNLEELDVQKVVYSNGEVNIRNGNSTDYDKIGELERYESIRVLKEYDDWYFILTNDYNFGFVNKDYTRDLEGIFVIVDKSEQKLYLYNNDELYYVTPVTTGKDSTPSDTGYFSIYSKETNRYLTGDDYRVLVNYWMPYNGGEGLHDASWRSVFGTESYHTGGSHGCVNIPSEITDEIYNNVSVGTKVLVHK